MPKTQTTTEISRILELVEARSEISRAVELLVDSLTNQIRAALLEAVNSKHKGTRLQARLLYLHLHYHHEAPPSVRSEPRRTRKRKRSTR